MAILAVNVGRMAFEEQLSEMRTAMIFLIIGIVCFIAAAVFFIVGKVKKVDSKEKARRKCSWTRKRCKAS